MKKSNLLLGLLFVLFSTGCNSESAEKAVQGYLSESLEDLKGQLPEELKMLDSLLIDSISIREKIAETTNLDSLEKYNKILLEAENLIKKDVSSIDSIHPEIRNILELNQ